MSVLIISLLVLCAFSAGMAVGLAEALWAVAEEEKWNAKREL